MREQIPDGTTVSVVTANRVREYVIGEPWPYRRAVAIAVKLDGNDGVMDLNAPLELRRGTEFRVTVTLPDCLTFKRGTR